MRSRYVVTLAVLLFVSFRLSAQTKYTATPTGFAPGDQIKLQIDTVSRLAIIKKNDDKPFWKGGSMQLLQNGAQIGVKPYAANDPQVTIPFSWNFTSGSRTYSAKAISDDKSQFWSGSVVVVATTVAPPAGPPVFSSGLVSPGNGEQSTSTFTWDVYAKSSNGQPFAVKVWIVQPNGVPVEFAMIPVSPNWSTTVRFTFQKKLQSFGTYSYYFTSGTARYPAQNAPGPSATPLVRKQMSATTHHVGVHLYKNLSLLKDHLRLIRETGTNKAMTACFQGNGQQAQLAVQIEATFADYAKGEQAFLTDLDKAIDLALSEGFAVHLLLSVHYRPANLKWRGYDFSQTWPGTATFVPYQPAKTRGSGPSTCTYDLIAETFHAEVLKHLVKNNRAAKLAVVYVMNEFDYDTKLAASEQWSGCGTTIDQRTECRNAALAYTAQRVLDVARRAAGGQVRVGLKFASITRPSSAFLKPSNKYLGDQLSYLLTSVMAPMGDVLGYDAYFDDKNPYDTTNYTRLFPFLPSFAGGRLEISEYGRIWKGSPSKFEMGARTRPSDLSGIVSFWSGARGFNLFAFNATGYPGGCYAIYDNGNWAKNGGHDGKAELAGLWNQITAITGSNPQPCSN